MNNVRVQSYSTMRDRIQSLCLLAGALLCLGLSGCAVNPVTGEHDFVMFGEETELEIGRANHSKIIAEYGRYEDEAYRPMFSLLVSGWRRSVIAMIWFTALRYLIRP